MISIAKRALLVVLGAAVVLGCGNGSALDVRHKSEALCSGACSDGPARFIFPFAGSGTTGLGNSVDSLSTAQFTSPGGLLYTAPGIGIIPANTLLIADTDNNRLRAAVGSVVEDIAGGGGQNLVTNPGCDVPGGASGVSGWQNPISGQALQCTSLGSSPLASVDAFDGNRYFSAAGSALLNQDIPIAVYAQYVDGGIQTFTLNAYSAIDSGNIAIEISFLDTNKVPLGITASVTARASNRKYSWNRLSRQFVAPAGARFVRIALRSNNSMGAFDGISLVGDGFCTFNKPQGLRQKGPSTVLLADTYNDRVQEFVFSGGGYTTTYSPAGLEAPSNVAADPTSGAIYIADFNHHRIARWLGGSDVPTTFAGTGTWGATGDGGLATAATLKYPSGVAVDSARNVYIADRSNAVIRKVGTDGKIQTIAGVMGVLANDGDGGAATSAHLIRPWAVAVGSDGALYVSDIGANNIRKIKNGIITTVAGNGTSGSAGDGGSALLAQFNQPGAFALDDSTGNLYVADAQNERVRIATCGNQNVCDGVETFNAATSVCVAGTAINPNDSNACTTDSCDPQLGAVHVNVPAGTSCADSNLCNGTETCNGTGACVAGTPKPIDDGQICTTDSCAPGSGVVSHTPTPGAQCSAGTCTAGVQTLPGLCTSTGTCAAGTTISCGKYACSGASCLLTCTTDSQCSAGNFCSAPNCAPKLGPNQSCTASNACLAGTCIDGGCCDASSAGDPLAGVTINANVPTDFVTQIRPLYNATSPTQVLGASGIDETRVAVIRGKVLNEMKLPRSRGQHDYATCC
jgi:hypothetical protein